MIKRSWFLELLGFKYIVNHHTKEIHRAESTDSRCRFFLMTKAERINKKKLQKLLTQGYNGCRWCMREYDLG